MMAVKIDGHNDERAAARATNAMAKVPIGELRRIGWKTGAKSNKRHCQTDETRSEGLSSGSAQAKRMMHRRRAQKAGELSTEVVLRLRRTCAELMGKTKTGVELEKL
jgi:hypothetical protein